MAKKAKTFLEMVGGMDKMVQDAKKELKQLRNLHTRGYCTPFGRIAELEKFVATRGASHGF